VEFLEGSFQAVEQDGEGIDSGDDVIGNLQEFESFTIQELTADLANPLFGGIVDVGDLNGRGYIDVNIVVPDYAADLIVDSVTDLDPEFTIEADDPETDGTLELDNTQAPVLLDVVGDTYTFRYWYNGTFETGDVTLTFIHDSITFEDLVGGEVGNFADTVQDGNEITVAGHAVTLLGARGPPGTYAYRFDVQGDVAVGEEVDISFNDGNWAYLGAGGNSVVETTRPLTVLTSSFTYIDIRFNTVGNTPIDEDTLDFDEFDLSGGGVGTATLDETQDPLLVGDNTYRYFFSRGFQAGSVVVEFTGNFADEDGNPGGTESESFEVIEAVQDESQTESENGPSTVFFIELSGGLELNGLGFLDEPILEIRGKVALEIGADLPDLFFSVFASGTVKVIKLGNIGSIAAKFVLKVALDFSEFPQFWGVAKIQANFEFLQSLGIDLEGSALLQINMTTHAKTERISLEGIPGDRIFEVAFPRPGATSSPWNGTSQRPRESSTSSASSWAKKPRSRQR
jgi:hypothetical protein